MKSTIFNVSKSRSITETGRMILKMNLANMQIDDIDMNPNMGCEFGKGSGVCPVIAREYCRQGAELQAKFEHRLLEIQSCE